MVLSSNWLELQNGTKLGANKAKKGSKAVKIKKDENRHKKAVRSERKGSKIMNMVYTMSKEIQKAEEDKRTGKKFEFKKETVAEVPSADFIEKPKLVNSEKAKAIGKYLAIDCEFVGVGPEGKENALARVSLVNYYGHVILDEFVKPREKVTDWRTWVSGVKPEHMKQAVSFKQVQQDVSRMLEGKILVGHSVKHDLESLLISHPKPMIRDTSRHLPFRQNFAKGKTPSLKKLAKEVLKLEIQGAEHSSLEDARITMMLYKAEKKEFEKLHKATFGFPTSGR